MLQKQIDQPEAWLSTTVKPTEMVALPKLTHKNSHITWVWTPSRREAIYWLSISWLTVHILVPSTVKHCMFSCQLQWILLQFPVPPMAKYCTFSCQLQWIMLQFSVQPTAKYYMFSCQLQWILLQFSVQPTAKHKSAGLTDLNDVPVIATYMTSLSHMTRFLCS